MPIFKSFDYVFTLKWYYFLIMKNTTPSASIIMINITKTPVKIKGRLLLIVSSIVVVVVLLEFVVVVVVLVPPPEATVVVVAPVG